MVKREKRSILGKNRKSGDLTDEEKKKALNRIDEILANIPQDEETKARLDKELDEQIEKNKLKIIEEYGEEATRGIILDDRINNHLFDPLMTEEEIKIKIFEDMENLARHEAGTSWMKLGTLLSFNSTEQMVGAGFKAIIDQNKIIIRQNELLLRELKKQTANNKLLLKELEKSNNLK